MGSKSWAVDGQFADDNYKDLIFTNPAIERFLSGHDQFIIVASKGMGKTLLMRRKRDIVQADPSIIAIPQNSQSDYVNLTGTYQQGLLSQMQGQDFWEHLWKLAIRVSVLLHFPHRITEKERSTAQTQLQHAELPGELRKPLEDALNGSFHTQLSPSSVLEILLRMPLSKLEKLRKSASQIISELTSRYVTSACFVFIDSFDQSIEHFRSATLEMWAAAQCGLLLAAWDISRNNRHIKVYVTIRQEAYASFEGPEANNLKGSVLLLRYSKEELHSLLVKAIRHYDGLQTVEEFVGLPEIFNEYTKSKEKTFDYIHRHLIDVPRWFTILGGKLSDLRANGSDRTSPEYEAHIREAVNYVSADLADDYLCKEMKLFFRGLDPKKMTRELFTRIHSTVLPLSKIERLEKIMSEEFEWKHSFSLLYNMGLLGMVRDRAGNQYRVQAFKRPYEFDWGFENVLPVDQKATYLLHPALHYLAKQHSPRCRYSGVLIGDGAPWPDENDRVIRKETIKLFISYSHADEELVREIVQFLEDGLSEVSHNDIWLDRLKMEVGRPVHVQIGTALKDCDFLILIASPNSLTSEFVKLEWESKLFVPFYDRTQTHDRVMPIYINGATSDHAPDFLRPIYGFVYRGRTDQAYIRRLVDQLVTTHRRAA